jgi:ABC-type Zn uptake system ZnuABC Zn-binding protein ZnuA
MPSDQSHPRNPGDPLLSRTNNPTSAKKVASYPEGDGSPRTPVNRRVFGPGVRLAVAVLLVAGVAFAIGQRGDNGDQTQVNVLSPESNTGAEQPAAATLRVLVSDPANTAIVREIAGDLLIVESIIPPGANGHTYEPVPGDAIKAASADLYIENGMELNQSVSNFVLANGSTELRIVNLSEAIPTNEVISTDTAEQIAAHGHAHSFNAHFWTDPNYVILYAEKIRTALVMVDPANEAIYNQNTETFVNRLRQIDAVFREAINSIPAETKKLVVYHDSWSYFGRRYGIPIVGAIQPVSFAEPSADEIRRMIQQIRRQGVPAFFGSEVFPSDVLETVAAETGATYFADLSDEELPGEPGSPEHSYEGMMIANVRLITGALGGNPSLLDALTTGGNS